jgi:tetratricopeptide (TPR) repeat protein/DNA-binding XRE family transcriptional regulator
MTDTGILGTWLRSCRGSAGLSQEELAERAGLSVRALSNIERGRTEYPHPGSLLRLADALALQGQARADLLELGRRPAERFPMAPGPVPPAGKVLIVPRQLPASVRQFVGRDHELAVLTSLLDEAGNCAAAVVISAIDGTAGIGKTALAVHFAHQASALFPDGQLYVNLSGFSPSGSPLAPTQAVRGFLAALGLAAEQIPQALEDQAGLYRSLLAGRRMLVVLDNAADEEQVRPLLPGSPGCLAVVTSRRQLTALAAAEGAALITLGYMPEAEARQLLINRLGAGRVAAEPGAARRLVTLCAALPLALAIAAARAAARPRLPLMTLAAELADSAGRLDALDACDPATGVRAAFSWSYQQLSGEAARTFRLLGLCPGPDISTAAAASLTGTAEADARRLLGELAHVNLISEHLPGRFAFHDLLRAYAADEARHADNEPDRQAAFGRVLDHYLHTAASAAQLLNPGNEPVVLAALRPGAAARQPADYAEALAWFEAEHQVLLAAVRLAAGSGSDSHAWQLPWAMADFLRIRGHWVESAAIQRTALAAATRLDDSAGQALSGRLLAAACHYLGDHDQARGHYASSLRLYRRLGNRLGEARIQNHLGALAEQQRHYADALGHAEQALRLYQAIGDAAAEAVALNNVGWCHALLADYEQARAFCQQSLAMCAETGPREVAANAWDSLGYAEHHLGNLAEAAACYQRALSLFRECGTRFSEADTLNHLGDTRHAVGEPAEAQEAWQEALGILEDLQHRDAALVRAKLASTNGHASKACAERSASATGQGRAASTHTTATAPSGISPASARTKPSR